ncbi:citrate lyase subunit beta/citryl-CoA lyase [Variovorax boronicumulans]|uniref:Citrate lyase subunit beta/citryl-CoA lyase n=1 Tax=Variovorax boronicumulans TaxID=436515 RepID=A0AAW8DU27_9BURK|nr:CoA ester lyase [Variovorax boronicumulans]MDP9877671.1 citrate lyase subunit beta/citryl-CoA lyase [Variovorax boronicumulans]MDP9922956.1 citrate lyase subunit beta/citryl-CoA lyase [Variovorax boronicumulans]
MNANKNPAARLPLEGRMLRSLLFAPANQAELVLKFPRAAADCSVLDLEDGTPPSQKDTARKNISDLVRQVRALGLTGLLGIRINAPDSAFFADDLAEVVNCGADAILIPKIQKPDDVLTVAAAVEAKGLHTALFAGIETAAGVLRAPQICECSTLLQAVFFGAEDLAADVGGRRTPEGNEVLMARSMVLLAAKAAGILAVDQAVVDIRNDALFTRDCETGRDLGYDGKTCLTPRQAALANQLFSPTTDEVAYAQRLVDAYEDARARGLGTFDFEGKMIDTPLLKRAQRILSSV